MRTIRCKKCGARILVVPDVRKINRAIEEHVARHRIEMLMRGASKARAISEGARVRHELAQQVLKAAARRVA